MARDQKADRACQYSSNMEDRQSSLRGARKKFSGDRTRSRKLIGQWGRNRRIANAYPDL
jgi:hypothetical protein